MNHEPRIRSPASTSDPGPGLRTLDSKTLDSERTQNALDALADLFLTGLDAGATAVRAEPAPAAEPVVAPDPAPRRAATLDGPAPIRLAPKLPRGEAASSTTGAPAAGASDTLDLEIEESIETPPDKPFLRLRRDAEPDDDAPVPDASAPVSEAPAPETDAQPDPAPAHPVLVEAVLLGNLPGVGGPWLTQYAQLLASQEGPVALLHVGDDEIDLELIEADDSRAHPLSLSGDGLVGVLRSLVQRQAAPVHTILVHMDESSDRATINRLLGLDYWTVLCGSDDAAVVSVYRTLKQLVEADDAAAAKHVGVMVMGSDEGPSRAAFGRVRAAADSFLHTPVQLVGWQKRLGPANVRRLGTYTGLDKLWPSLESFFRTLTPPEFQDESSEAAADESASPPAPEPSKPARPAPVARPQPVRTPPPKIFTGPIPRRRPRVSASAPVAARPNPAEAPQARREAAAPRPTPAPVANTPPPRATAPPEAVEPAPAPRIAEPVAADSTADIEQPNLAQLITTGPRGIPGGVALEARCPHHPHTQLVLDQAGRLHLLRSVQSGEQAPGVGSAITDPGLHALRAAILDLLEARRWVQEHVSLLQLTQRQLRIDGRAEPVLHLFTDRADLATALVARLGDTLKLHLLQHVRVGVHATWFCTPLS